MKELIKCGGAIFKKEMLNHAVIIPYKESKDILCISVSIKGMGDNIPIYVSKDTLKVKETMDKLSKDLGL